MLKCRIYIHASERRFLKNYKDRIHYKKIEELFGFTRQTWSKWQKEDRAITRLINKYFNNYDIIEFLSTDKVTKIENVEVGKELVNILNTKCEHILNQIINIEQPKNNSPREALIAFITIWYKLNQYNIETLENESKIKDNFFNCILDVSSKKNLEDINTNVYSMYHILRILEQLNEYEFKYFIFNYFTIWKTFTSDILTEILKSNIDETT